MRTIGIVQARMGSTRLPYKMMLSLHGMPIIEWVLKRSSKSKLLSDLIVAVPDTNENDILANYITNLGFSVYRGSENNVLNRFYEAAKIKNADHIVRICADNPLIDGGEIDNLIIFYQDNRCDYAYNHIPKNNLYSDGFGAEIISFNLLQNLNANAKEDRHKEHCLSYITDNQNDFIIKTFNPKDTKLYRPDLRFDIDTYEDYYKLSMKHYDVNITTRELIELFG